MNYLILAISLCLTNALYADTMDHYMNIINQIPKMEMRADPKAQAWARSARTVLALTNETLAETLLQANTMAQSQGKPFFCLPAGFVLNDATINTIITQTYRGISSQASDKNKMTVSELAWLGIIKMYPCSGNSPASAQNNHTPPSSMQHLDALLGSKS